MPERQDFVDSLHRSTPGEIPRILGRGESTLLIVDDDEHFADTLVVEFMDRGYSVEWLDGLQAVQNKSDLNYRFAVIDLRLGRDSGLDVIKVVKARSPSTVVAVLTGYGSSEIAVQALEVGASAFLTKPIDIDRLEDALLRGDLGQRIPAQSEA